MVTRLWKDWELDPNHFHFLLTYINQHAKAFFPKTFLKKNHMMMSYTDAQYRSEEIAPFAATPILLWQASFFVVVSSARFMFYVLLFPYSICALNGSTGLTMFWCSHIFQTVVQHGLCFMFYVFVLCFMINYFFTFLLISTKQGLLW